jgi:hypothetical protein
MNSQDDVFLFINNVKIRAKDLTLDNFEQMTNGHRFRFHQNQYRKVLSGELTREEAFKEWLDLMVEKAKHENPR